MISVMFALNLNPDLVDHTNRYVEVKVKKAQSVDDLMYALRKGVSEATKLPLARVVLRLKGEPIDTAEDVARAKVDLSATTAVTLASEGELTVAVKKKQTLNQTQIEEIREQEWREIREMPKENVDLLQSVDSDGMPAKTNVRQSLEAALKDLEGKGGLSNEEYANKASALADLDKLLAEKEKDKESKHAAAEMQNVDKGAMSTSVENIVKTDSASDGAHGLPVVEAESEEHGAAAGASSSEPMRSSRAMEATKEQDSDVLDIPVMEEDEGNEHENENENVDAVEEEAKNNVFKEDSEHREKVEGEQEQEREAEVAPPRQKISSPPVETASDVADVLDQTKAADVLRETDESQITFDSFNDSVTSDIREFAQSEVISRADEYERVAEESFKSTGGTTSTGLRSSDPTSRTAPSSAVSKASTASPFGLMSFADADESETGDEIQAEGADLNDRGLENDADGTASLASGSLALSESHDSL